MKRIPELDGLRGYAVILVIIWHYYAVMVNSSSLFFNKYLYAIATQFWSGVDLFFVLSGFLITGILLDNKTAKDYYKVFYVRRMGRIFPLYFALLGAFMLLRFINFEHSHNMLFASQLPFWSYLTFTQNFFMGVNGNYGPLMLGISWSLAVEEQFYLFLPLVIRSVRRNWIPYIIITLIFIAPLLRFIFPGFHTHVWPLFRTEPLFIGALLAYLIRSDKGREFLDKRFTLIMLVTGIILGACLVVYRFNRDLKDLGAFFWYALLYGAVLLFILQKKLPRFQKIFFRNPVVVWFGLRSYGIYLIHQGVLGAFFALFRQSAPILLVPMDLVLVVASLLVSLVLAELSFRTFEAYFMRLVHKVKYVPAGD